MILIYFKKKHLVFGIIILITKLMLAQNDEVRLLMRMDDLGQNHATNIASIEAYQNGIGTSVEVVVPGPWFEEAVDLITKNPGLDVGIHIALTSEWENMKWRPLTSCPSLTDEYGYFLPMVWGNPNFRDNQCLSQINWDIDEMEKEVRAQIELALKKIPQITHLSHHMGCLGINEETLALYEKMAKTYNLKILYKNDTIKRAPKWNEKDMYGRKKINAFIRMLNNLEPGSYTVVGHLNYNNEESRAIGHKGYYNVAQHRMADYEVYTSKKVSRLLKKKGIKLISYKDL